MSQARNTLRLETLLALSLSERWSTDDDDDTRSESNNLPFPLAGLNSSDNRAIRKLLTGYQQLSLADQSRWRTNRVNRIRAISPERNRRFESGIHTSQIIEALTDEPPLIQSIIVRSLPALHRSQVASALKLDVSHTTSNDTQEVSSAPKLFDVVRQGFFERFVSADALKDAVAFDVLSTIELARLIRLLGARETAIACQGIAAVEAVTAFLKRFSAEDTHAIVSNFTVVKSVDSERLDFAEQVVRRAINVGSDVSAAMLDRVGLSLLAIVLDTRGPLRRRHIVQKLSIQAAAEVGELMDQTICTETMAHRLVEEVESLALKLHRGAEADAQERRGRLSLQ